MASEHQSYFTDAPYRVINDKTVCYFFIDNSESGYLTQQKETDGKRGIDSEQVDNGNSKAESGGGD